MIKWLKNWWNNSWNQVTESEDSKFDKDYSRGWDHAEDIWKSTPTRNARNLLAN